MRLKEECEIRNSGLKLTRHRQEIFQLLKECEQPVTAEQVYGMLLEKKVSINLSTVYRILDMLTDSELVSKINIGKDNKNHYEYNCLKHRHYLVCLSCNSIFAVGDCPLGEYEKRVAEQTDFLITGHKLNMYGYCSSCKDKLKEKGF